MDTGFIHAKLPKGAVKAKYEAELYRLKHRKRQMYDGNRELREGLRYLIYSRFGHCFYERELNSLQDTEENIAYYVHHRLIYIWPTEEQREEIREDCKNEKLGYYSLMERRQNEIDWDRLRRQKNDGDAYQFKLKTHREMIDKLKMKYKPKKK